jgi:hypothetical protein
MAKPAITKRGTKAAALTYAELDTNFQNLADATVSLTAGTGGTQVTADLNGNITIIAGSNITLTGDNTAKTLTINSSGLPDLVLDTTPQLGGNLDVNGYQIISISNSNIVLSPNGTGQTLIKNLEYNENIYSLGTTNGTIAPDAANGNIQTITLNGNLTLNTFTNPIAGQSITLIVNTGGTGRTLTSTMKWAGATKTLSTTSTIDVINIFYDGTNYLASLIKGYV